MSFPRDVPSAEIRPAASLPRDPARDIGAVVAGKTDGRVVVINWEDRTAKSQTSSDSGTSFTTETVIPSGPPTLGITELGVDFNLDNGSDQIYALMTVADPDGDLGLQVVRSDDYGASWGTPVDIVRHGDDTHGVAGARISANSGGVVAVAYRETRGGDPYIRVSSDSGQTWTARVRLNAGVADAAGNLGESLWVQVDGSGIIHAAFVEDRGSGRQVFYTRSADGGTSFEAERDFDLVVSARAGSANPIIQVALDGSILLAFWDAAGNDHMYVLRSTDAGVNFTQVLDRTFADEGIELFPMLFASTANATVVAHVIDGDGKLTTQRSTDNGASFDNPARTLSSTAAGHPLLGISAASVTRTDAGTLAIAYTDNRSDAYLGSFTDLFVQISTNEGFSWAAESRVDGTAAGTSGTGLGLPGISGVGTDDLVLVYADNRGSAGSSFDVYSNRSAAATPSFVSEQRIDSDTGDRDRNVFNSPGVAVGGACGADAGAENVYVAMSVRSGAEPEIRVAVSTDGGYTFATPTRVSDSAGEEFAAVPRIVATVGGSVHVAYTVVDQATGRVELRYSKSDDCGQTWLPSERNFGGVFQSEFDLIALDTGEVYLVWADGFDILMAKSTDGGDTFAPEVFVNTNLTGFNRNPLACVAGGTLFVAFAAPDGPSAWFTTFVTASGDGGATFEPEIQMIPDMASGGAFEHTLDCYESLTGTAGVYAVVMANSFSSNRFPHIRWWEFNSAGGGTLSPLTLFTSSAGTDYGAGSGVLCLDTEPGPGSCLFLMDQSVSDPNGNPNRVALREYDSTGLLALEHVLTAGAPLPDARSETSRMVSDDLGNIWVAWRDFSAGEPEMVVRHSADSGQTFDSLYRLSRPEPQGTTFDSLFNFIKKGYSAATDGEAFFVWAGGRESTFFSGLFGAYDTDDFDRDGSGTAVDCDDQDPNAQSVPAELTNLGIEKVAGAVRLTWDSQAATAGSGTVYDLVKGSLSDLRGSGSFAAAGCLVSDEPDASFDDTSVDPPVGDADYYLGRAENSCAASSYGNSSIGPDPRDDLDAAGPCP